MEILIVGLIIVFFLLLNSLNFIVKALSTPPDMIFLGTVHWEGDYFYYLSQFAQGRENWFLSYDLYTTDFHKKTLVGFANVFLGHVFSLVGIDQFGAYQLSIVFFGLLFLLFSYLLLREIFPGREKSQKVKRLIAFILFAGNNAFPRIVEEGGKKIISYSDFWFNPGLPFYRLGGVPHHLIERSMIVGTMLLAVYWWKKKKFTQISLFTFSLLGFVLGGIDPVHFLLGSATLLITAFFISPVWRQILHSLVLILKKLIRFLFPGILPISLLTRSISSLQPSVINNKQSTINIISHFFPFIFFFLAGAPIVIYLKQLFILPPYSQLALWEAAGQMNLRLTDFMIGIGPVAYLCIPGLIIFIKNINPAKLLGIVFTLLAVIIFFSPLPMLLGVVNVRFLSVVIILFASAFSAEIITFLGKLIGKKENLYSLILLILVFIPIILTFFVQIQSRIKPDFGNSFYYLPKQAFDILKKAGRISTEKDNFLVLWPFNWPFPGVSGRRSFEGHSLLTINFAVKEKKSYEFFYKMNEESMKVFLADNKIDYIIGYPWIENMSKLHTLQKIEDSGYLAIYKVIKN